MKTLITAVAVVACAASPALGQKAESNGGFKVGIVTGYDNVNLKYDGESDSKGGFLYGLSAGYDADLGNVLIGAEIEASDSTTKYTLTDGSDSVSIKSGRDLYAGVRVGYPVGPDFSIYAKGGYTNARVKGSLVLDGDTYSDGVNLDGYRVGAGVEYLSGWQFVRIEYRYSDYGKVEIEDIDTGISARRHQVALTTGFRF